MIDVRGQLVVVVVFCALALGGCGFVTPGPHFAQPISVTSTTTDKFFYVDAYTFTQAGPDEHSRRQQMMTRPAFGPYQANQTTLQLTVGLQYLFYPRCADAVSWTDVVSPLISSSTHQLPVECR